MRIRIYPHKQGSRSAAALAAALGGRVLKLEGSRFRVRPNDLIINWGNSGGAPGEPLNRGQAIRQASDKLRAFNALREGGVRTPRFWSNRNDISEDVRWPLVCRTVLNGHSGRGIVLAHRPDEIVEAPLYTEYVPKVDEYRVHVVGGTVVAVQRKARRLDVDQPNWQVRNHANGFNFVREGVNPPADVIGQALASIIALGLDFGGVDVIWNERQQQAYVLEVNTACGLEGQTVDDYANAFKRLIDVQRG